MNTIKKIGLVSAVTFALFAFNACDDDSSTSSPTAKLPTEVKDLKELEEHKCDMSVIGEKVFVESEDLLYECDGDAWFKSYDQTKPNSAKSSSSTKVDGDDENSPDSEKGSSSSVAPSDVASSESKNGNSSSSVNSSSSSSESEIPKSYAEAKVMPSGTYDCTKYKCFSTEYLNQEILAAGKYGEMLDTRDGQVYKTTEICDRNNENCQTWMAQNLNYRYVGVKYSRGVYTSDSTSWCYGEETSNCDKYGRLYTWSAVMDSTAQFSVNAGTKCGYGKVCTPNSPHRGICPEGWHVPTNEEYSSLYKYIGGSNTAGSLLKSTSGWEDDGNGTDKYGFSVLPAGERDYSGFFSNEGRFALLWTTSDVASYYAWSQRFSFEKVNSYQSYLDEYYGHSLRCVKDSE